MPSTETPPSAPTRDPAVPEKRPPRRDWLLPVFMIVGGLLTAAWLCLLVLLGLRLIGAVL